MYTNIYEAEAAISKIIEKDNNCTAHFEYKEKVLNGITLNSGLYPTKNFIVLNLLTFNPIHKAAFLLHSLQAKDKLSCLNAMYKYLYELKNVLAKKDTPLLNYTVSWFNKAQEKKIDSHFYGQNIQEVVHKFFFGKSNDNIIIYAIKLNPMC